MTIANDSPRTVLVTGANGYIGSAICRAFVRAGWKTFGLIRKAEAATELELAEAIPVVGTFTDHGFLDALYEKSQTFDAIVSCTEQFPGYAAHFAQVMGLVQILAAKSNENGVRPLVLWSSGCKDYGVTAVHGAPDLSPHTEESPFNGPELVRERQESCMTIFDHPKLFDAVLLRPTCVFGLSSSYYGAMFDFVADEAATGAKTLRVPNNPDSIMHATHVDDCAESYLALAQYKDRKAIAGQAFNISSHRYETTREVTEALAKEYGFEGGVEFVSPAEAPTSYPSGLHSLFGFSQWVGSDKIRQTIGWTDKRLLFSQNVAVHRRAYEALKERGHGNIATVQHRIGTGKMQKIGFARKA
ncbi:hypothetical protein EDB81DRAFT_810436 [Dactylonectria macrodidyma]|uniref:NAD-dependent epimerase/dehydratase domain-containing protein n=1 Tax=Dactylonectria macrodidyma TaxID=307937 RepID=A0A9P9DT32_9HYPO|nr:hypothetical protein EDB81DRAFT_810436 [Dactylonectria macrodidyma]